MQSLRATTIHDTTTHDTTTHDTTTHDTTTHDTTIKTIMAINSELLSILYLKKSTHTDYFENKSFTIDKKNIKQLKVEKQIGLNKKITVASTANPEKKPIEITQTYFSGLVYRLDTRSLSEINAREGFYPKNKKETNEPLLAKNVCSVKKHDNQEDIVESNVFTWNQKGIVATSKNFDVFNVDRKWNNHFKYVIDSTVDDNYGLDIDKTMQFPEGCEKYEVVFEKPIKKECIVGYFNGMIHNTTFYPNSLYRGCFSWESENVVVDYKSKITKHNF